MSQGECRVWPSRGEGSAHRIARCCRHLLWKLQDHPGLEICEYPWLIWFTDPPATSKVRGWWSGGRCGAAPSFHLCFSYLWPSDSCHGQCSDFALHKGRIFKNTSRRDEILPGWKLETNWKLWGFFWGNIIWHTIQGLKRILLPGFNSKDWRQTQMSSGLLSLLQFGLHVNCEGLWRATCSLTECCWTHLLPSRRLIRIEIWKLLEHSFIIIVNTRLWQVMERSSRSASVTHRSQLSGFVSMLWNVDPNYIK